MNSAEEDGEDRGWRILPHGATALAIARGEATAHGGRRAPPLPTEGPCRATATNAPASPTSHRGVRRSRREAVRGEVAQHRPRLGGALSGRCAHPGFAGVPTWHDGDVRLAIVEASRGSSPTPWLASSAASGASSVETRARMTARRPPSAATGQRGHRPRNGARGAAS